MPAWDGRTIVAVDDAEPALFVIDTQTERARDVVRLKDVPKAAQIVRYAPDWSLLGVTSLNSDAVSLIDPSFGEQIAIAVGSQPMDMAFHSDELFVACQGDGSIHVNRPSLALLLNRDAMVVRPRASMTALTPRPTSRGRTNWCRKRSPSTQILPGRT